MTATTSDVYVTPSQAKISSKQKRASWAFAQIWFHQIARYFIVVDFTLESYYGVGASLGN